MLHKNILLGDNHFIQHWEVSDSNARTALSSAFVSNDIGKVARQTDNSNFYILQNTTGTGLWSPINGGGGGVGTQFSGTNISGTLDTNGISLSVANPTGLVFSNSNGLTFGTNAGTVTASHNGLTTAALSNHSHGVTLALTNINGTTGGNSNGISLSLSVAPQSVQTQNSVQVQGSSGNISFGNGNGVTFGGNASTITASVATDYVRTSNSSLLQHTSATSNITSNALHTSVSSRFAGTGFSGTNISGTVNSNGIQLSVAPGGGGADGFNILAAGTQTANTTGTVVFNNSNGISFGMSNNSVITASYTVPTQTVDTNKAGTGFTSAGANIGLSGTLNTNGLSLSATVPAQTAFVLSNSNNVSFGTVGSTVTATATFNQSNQTANLYALGNTTQLSSSGGIDVRSLSFEGAGNITVGVSNGRVLVSAAAGGQSVQTQNLHNVTISGNSTSSGATGYAQVSSGTLTLVGGNNITIRQDGNRIELSGPNVAGAQTGISAISAGTTQMTQGTAVFSNANGITFGVNGNTLTASHNGLTTAALSNHSHGVTLNLTNISGTTGGNSNGISLSLSANAQSVQTQNSVQIQGSSGNINFSNSNGITFGFNNSTITASHNGLTTAALSNHSHGNPTLALTNLSGTTASNSNGLTLSLSAAAPGGGGGGAAISAAGNSQNTGTVVFSNSNNVTFGMAGSVVTATAGGGGIGVPGSTITAGSLVFSNSNGVSFGLNGSTMTASVAGGGGGGNTASYWENMEFPASGIVGQTLGAIGASTGSVRIIPMYLREGVTASYLGWFQTQSLVTSTIAGSQSISSFVGIYNSNSSLVSSGSFSYALSVSSVSGTITYAQLGNSANMSSSSWSATAQGQSIIGTVGVFRQLFPYTSNFPAGLYFAGFLQRASTVGAAVGILPAMIGRPILPSVSIRDLADNATGYSTKHGVFGAGLRINGEISVTTTALPNTFSNSQLNLSRSNVPLIHLRT